MLRGKLGHIHSWVYHEKEELVSQDGDVILRHMPKVLYVKIEGAKWKLPGCKIRGLYPIKPSTKLWYLDQNRLVPRLKIKRKQFPIAPAFASTAHAAQGQTLEAAIVDLCCGDDMSPFTSYVALSRVRRAQDLLIYRPFLLRSFTRPRALGPQLLLRHLRGEDIDWSEISTRIHRSEFGSSGKVDAPEDALIHEADGTTVAETGTATTGSRKRKYFETQDRTNFSCARCKKTKTNKEFPAYVKRLKKAARECKECLMSRKNSKVIYCVTCKASKSHDAFPVHVRIIKKRKRECTSCSSIKQLACVKCGCCSREQAASEFPAIAPRQKDTQRVCFTCLRDCCRCVSCNKKKLETEFSADRKTSKRICKQCVQLYGHHSICGRCLQRKKAIAFTVDEWKKAPGIAVCKLCEQEFESCSVCGLQEPAVTFSLIGNFRQQGKVKCDHCFRPTARKGHAVCGNSDCKKKKKRSHGHNLRNVHHHT